MPPKKQPGNNKAKTRRVVKIAEWAEAKHAESAIHIEGLDGSEFVIPPAVLWTEEQIMAARTGDAILQAKALFGDQYDAFCAAGGTPVMVDELIKDEWGLRPPESSASSTS